MRIAARSTIGNIDLKWMVKDSATAEPSYQNHYLVAEHALIPGFSRIEFMGHREDFAAQSWARALELAQGSPIVENTR